MARWKIINCEKAEELGIEGISADNDGFIAVDLAKIPVGLTVRNVIEFAEKNGILLKDSSHNEV